MADTRRELAALQTLLADNTAGDISAQDARDVLVSESPSFVHPTSAFASPPSTPVTGDLWVPSDGFGVYRYSGSAWVPWGPLFPFTEPTLQTFAWVNQGSATVSTTNGGIFLSAPASATAEMHIRKKAAPTPPYTVTAWMTPLILVLQYHNFGLLFRESSSGKCHACYLFMDDTIHGMKFGSDKWTNATTFSAGYISNIEIPHSSVLCLRIADDNTNRIVSMSWDGVNFIQLHSVGRTDFLTADEVGFFAAPRNATYGSGVLLHSWKEA